MNATPVPATFVESLLRFDGMLGVLAAPVVRPAHRDVGVVIVVGGPQTRVGSHRQFVLMARALAQQGFACLRFDYRGIGDSPGSMPDFERAGPDIRRSCDALQHELPHCSRLVLWGLCEGATAALFHSLDDERIAAVIGANPWARSDATRSRALVTQHYGARLRSREFWMRVAAGKVDVGGALREAVRHLRRALRGGKAATSGGAAESLPIRVARALRSSRCPVHVQLSGNDLTAAEFEVAVADALFAPQLSCFRLEHADHTFSSPEDWQALVRDTIAVLEGLDRAPGTRATTSAAELPA